MLNLAHIFEAICGVPSELIEQSSLANGRSTLNIHQLLRQPITGAVADSRQAFAGVMFVALLGEQADGHDYIADAFQRGARLALIHEEKSYPPYQINSWILKYKGKIESRKFELK